MKKSHATCEKKYELIVGCKVHVRQVWIIEVMEGKELTSQPLGAHHMTETLKSILKDLAQTGYATILNHSVRELNAAQELIDAGICYRSNTMTGYFIIKFGKEAV